MDAVARQLSTVGASTQAAMRVNAAVPRKLAAPVNTGAQVNAAVPRKLAAPVNTGAQVSPAVRRDLAALVSPAVPVNAKAPVNAATQLPQLRRVIGQVVGRTFYGTLLKQMRDSSMRGAYGHGGRGEEAFSAQLHDLLAERIGASQAEELSDAMVKRLSRQQAAVDRERAAVDREPAEFGRG